MLTPAQAPAGAEVEMRCRRIFIVSINLFIAAGAVPSFAQTAPPVPSPHEPSWAVTTILLLIALIVALLIFLLRNLKRTSSALKFKNKERKIFLATQEIVPPVLAAGGIGVIGIFLWAAGTTETNAAFFKLAASMLLAACAAAGAGSVLGFLFGVPRTIEATRTAVAAQNQNDANAVAAHASLVANTNLERVSDWLTTLLIGATLVQLGSIGKALQSIGDFVSDPAKSSSAIAAIVMVYAFILGFLGTYLITRIYLTYAFRDTLGMLAGVRSDQDGSKNGVGPGAAKDSPDSTKQDGDNKATAPALSPADQPLSELNYYEQEAQHI